MTSSLTEWWQSVSQGQPLTWGHFLESQGESTLYTRITPVSFQGNYVHGLAGIPGIGGYNGVDVTNVNATGGEGWSFGAGGTNLVFARPNEANFALDWIDHRRREAYLNLPYSASQARAVTDFLGRYATGPLAPTASGESPTVPFHNTGTSGTPVNLDAVDEPNGQIQGIGAAGAIILGALLFWRS